LLVPLTDAVKVGGGGGDVGGGVVGAGDDVRLDEEPPQPAMRDTARMARTAADGRIVGPWNRRSKLSFKTVVAALSTESVRTITDARALPP
jgi:hypothetical protein